MTKERKEATHATLWGKKEWDQQIAYKHGPHRRYARVLARSIYSPLMRGLAPTIALLSVWSVFVFQRKLTITANGLGFLASPIGLLLAFRVNSCVSRFHAARGDVGEDDVCMSGRRVHLIGLFRDRPRDEGAVRCSLNGLRLVRQGRVDVRRSSSSEVVRTLLTDEDASRDSTKVLPVARPQGDPLPLGHHVGNRVEINHVER